MTYEKTSIIRIYFQGNNIRTVFLPVMKYKKNNEKDYMLHFVIICECLPEESAFPQELQDAAAFINLKNLVLNDSSIEVDDSTALANEGRPDPIDLLKKYNFIEQ